MIAPAKGSMRAQKYAKDGFVVIDELWGRAEVERIKEEVERVFRTTAGRRGPMISPDTAFDRLLEAMFSECRSSYLGAAKLCNHLNSVHRMGLDLRVERLLQELGLSCPTICARPLLWFHSPRLATTERYHRLPAHQEWSNMQGSLDGVVVWAPLVHIDASMGRLQVVPRSHRQGLVPLSGGVQSDYPLAADVDRIKDEAFVEVDVPVGGAVVFSAFLIHRSGTNASLRTRLTANFRFNNAEEPTFVDRDYLNPFRYEAPVGLHTPDFPTRADLAKLWRVLP